MRPKLVLVPVPYIKYLVAFFDEELWILSDFKADSDALRREIAAGNVAFEALSSGKKVRIAYPDITEIRDVTTATDLYLCTKAGEMHAIELPSRKRVEEVLQILTEGINRTYETAEEKVRALEMTWPPLVALAFAVAIFGFMAVAAGGSGVAAASSCA